MMNWIAIILISLVSAYSYAGSSYTQTQCDNIKKQREVIRSQFRNGYSVKEGERLTARDKRLFTQIANHCNKPKKSSSAPSTPNKKANHSNWLLNQKVSNMSLHSDSYKDAAKLDAWSKFYKLPKRCRKKGMKSADFVWCSEYRGKQKELFEAQWQGRP